MFSMTILSILTTALLLWNVEAEETALDKDWVDPTDMINYDPITKRMKNQNKFLGSSEDVKILIIDENTSNEDLETKCSKFCHLGSDDCESLTGPLKAELASFNETVKELRSQVALCKELREQTFFHQYIKVLLERFKNLALTNENDHHYKVQVKLTSDQYGYLQKYVLGEQDSIQEVHSILVSMHQDVRMFTVSALAFCIFSFVGYGRSCLSTSWSDTNVFVAADGDEFWSHSLQYLLIAVQILCGMCSILLLCKQCPRSAWWIATRLSLVLFIVSVGWTWWHLVKKEIAARNARMLKIVPQSCLSESASLFSMLLPLITLTSDKCAQYHEDQEINPVLLVPPTKALVVTISSFVLEPAEHIGRALNKLTVAAFSDLPFYLFVPVFVLIIVLLVLFVLVGSGYRFSSLFFNIEPHRDSDSQRNPSLVSENSNQRQEITQLRDELQRIKERDTQLESQNLRQHQEIALLEIKLQQRFQLEAASQQLMLTAASTNGEGDQLTETHNYPMVCSEMHVCTQKTTVQPADSCDTETLGAADLTSSTVVIQSFEADFEVINRPT